MKNVAGYHPGPVTPSTTDVAPLVRTTRLSQTPLYPCSVITVGTGYNPFSTWEEILVDGKNSKRNRDDSKKVGRPA